MTNPVFVAPTVQAAQRSLPLPRVSVGDHVCVEGDEARHAQKAQRLREGEILDLVDGQGTRVTAKVASGPREVLTVEVLAVLCEEEPRPAFVLVQALAKGGRDEQAVETATEMGVDRVIPWAASRSIVRWDAKKKQSGRDRWQRVATAAAKQSRRARIPEVSNLHTGKQLVEQVAETVQDGGVVLIAHESGSPSLTEVVAEMEPTLLQAPSVTVIIGPEGGISDDELQDLIEAGGTVVTLGSVVMRSSTAGPALLAALNYILGRW